MDDKLLRVRQLYEALTIGGTLPDDRTLARSQTYKELLTLGIELCEAVGATRFDWLSNNLYGPDNPASQAAALVLRHWWAGLSTHYGQGVPAQKRRTEFMADNHDYVMSVLPGPLFPASARASSKAGLALRQGQAIKLH